MLRLVGCGNMLFFMAISKTCYILQHKKNSNLDNVNHVLFIILTLCPLMWVFLNYNGP